MANKDSKIFNKLPFRKRAVKRIIPLGIAILTAFLCVVRSPAQAFLSNTNAIAQNPITATQLIEQGKQLYKAEKWLDAANIFQQAADAFSAQKNEMGQAMALSNLSLCFQKVGKWTEADRAITESLNLLRTGQNIANSTERLQILAQALNIQGSLQFGQGRSDLALTTWEEATKTFERISDRTGISRSLINQSLAMQSLGLYRRACGTLLQTLKVQQSNCQALTPNETATIVNQSIQKLSESHQIAALKNLGDVLRSLGNLEMSEAILTQTLKSLPIQEAPSEFLISLGNTKVALSKKYKYFKDEEKAKSESEKALDSYQEAISTSSSPSTQLRAKLNLLSLLIDIKPETDTSDLIKQIQTQVTQLPLSREAIDARIDLAQSLTCLRLKKDSNKSQSQGQYLSPFTRLCSDSDSQVKADNLVSAPEWAEIGKILAEASRNAQSLGDARSQSYALGELGELYEINQQWSSATELTKEALHLAQSHQVWDIAYRWQWQLGRLSIKEKGDIQRAIALYEEAVKTLDSLRLDLKGLNSEVQFSFRDNVEPIYRELVTLLLPPDENNPSQENLKKAIYFIDSLQVAELENFFQCVLRNNYIVRNRQPNPLINSTERLLDRINQVIGENSHAALIYPIVLEKHLAVIMKLPGSDNLLYHQTKIDKKLVEEKLDAIRNQTLTNPNFSEEDDKGLLVEVYSWLIEPFRKYLPPERINTIVFVLDGFLRNMPMAALHDGEEFLVKSYAMSLVPSIQLLKFEASPPKQVKALVGGLSAKREDLGFVNTITNAPQEIEIIEENLKNPKPTILREQQFTSKAFQERIKSSVFNLIHLATHGRFSSDIQKTIILTASQDPLRLNELEGLLRGREQSRPDDLWLFVLSACETAKGDDRAVLGIAGVAVKSGAQSTLATLWLADDSPTKEFMDKFYEALFKDKTSKAEALRRAQIYLLENKRYVPSTWATFVLVGNWL